MSSTVPNRRSTPPSGIGFHRTLRQFKGLSVKQYTLLRRSRCQCCCQLAFPVILLLYYLLFASIGSAVPDDIDGSLFWSCRNDADCFTLFPPWDLAAAQPVLSHPMRNYVGTAANGITSPPGFRSVLENVTSENGWFVDNLNDPVAYSRLPLFEVVRNETFFDVQQFVCVEYCDEPPLVFPDGELRYTPGFGELDEDKEEWLESRKVAIQEQFQAQENCVFGQVEEDDFVAIQECLDGIRGGETAIPSALVEFTTADVTTLDFEWSMTVNPGPYRFRSEFSSSTSEKVMTPGGNELCAMFDESRFDDFGFFSSTPGLNSWDCERLAVMSEVHNSLLREVSGNPDARIVVGVGEFPSAFSADFLSFVDTFFLFVAPLSMEWILPMVMYEVIHERQQGLRELMALNGLAARAYWVAQLLWNLSVFYLIGGMFFLVSYFYAVNFLSYQLWVPLLLIFAAGPALTAFGYFLAQFFASTRKALFAGYSWVIIVGMTASIMNFEAFPLTFVSPVWALLLPSYSFRRALHLFIAFQGHNGRVPFSLGGPLPPDLVPASVALILSGPLYMALALWADSVFKHGTGMGRHPLWPIYTLGGWLGLIDDPDALDVTKTETGEDEKTPIVEGDDVAQERALVSGGGLREDCPLIVKGLRKVYPGSGGAPPKLALNGMYLHMNADEVLCLLGPNGCGKTTLMNVLVGVHGASGGSATVGGADIATQMGAVRSQLGVVQQFDVLFDKLTCIETTIFFCRIQGLSAHEEARVANEALRLVGLEQAAGMQAGALSGGMRRRLSIAIAICGKPKLIFMDEPTTGLDPETRRALWDIITNLKENRAICLTTHMMDEAETLADRVAIMAKGRLAAIGTATHLKQQFGQGYALGINYELHRRDDAHRFVMSIASNATIVREFPGQITYTIPPPVLVSAIFEAMELHRAEHGIPTWGISQASLEDVFLNIIHDEDLDGADQILSQDGPAGPSV